jgi:PTS system mannose-specific IIA component
MNSNNENIFVVSNANLAIILSILFVGVENLTSEIIEGCIVDSQVILVPTTLIQEEEETFF